MKEIETVVVGAGQAGTAGAPAHCEIEASPVNGMVALQGVVHTDAGTSGSYKFHVTSAGGSGNTNIQQGGSFTAGRDGAARLGKVTLGNTGAIYEATLRITANGKSFQCAERVGGAI